MLRLTHWISQWHSLCLQHRVKSSGFSRRVTLYADASSTVTLKVRSTAGDNHVQMVVTLIGRLVWPACWTTPQ